MNKRPLTYGRGVDDLWEQSVASDDCFSGVIIAKGIPTKLSRITIGQEPLSSRYCGDVEQVAGGD